MRIAYSCAGEGFGHAARMVALNRDLAARYEVSLFVPEEVKSFVVNRLPGAQLRSIPCFSLVKRGNRIDYSATVFAALRLSRGLVPELLRLARTLRSLGVDAVLSDFEPFLPWAAALAGIPVVQMNHPGVVIDYLDADPRSWAAAAAARLMEGPWDRRIIVSFYGGDVGPILRESLLRRPLRDEGFLAVNLKEGIRSRVLPILDSVPALRYRLYPAPGADFDEGLASCSAVLSGAGHQTISEALCLGKPILALPQEDQFEQTLNARMLERSGRGTYCSVAELPRALPRFLSRLGEYRSPRILPARFALVDSRAELLSLLQDRLGSLVSRRGTPLSVGTRSAV